MKYLPRKHVAYLLWLHVLDGVTAALVASLERLWLLCNMGVAVWRESM